MKPFQGKTGQVWRPGLSFFGFTLAELVMSTVLFAALAFASVYVLRSVLLAWSSQEGRGGMMINLHRGLEEMSRDLRKAREVQSTPGYHEIRFRQGASDYSIFYLYNADDPYGPPPSFNQTSYQLRKAALAGGLSGTFTYGSGHVIVNDVAPPPSSDLSLSGNLITIDLTVRRADETRRSRTQIRPRNV